MRAFIFLSFVIVLGGCNFLPVSGNGLSRGPANALPEKRVFPVSIQEGLKAISNGAAFEVTCTGKSAKAQAADVTVEVFASGSNDTRMFRTTLAEFARALGQLGTKTVVSANHTYWMARESLYYQNTQGSARIYDSHETMVEACAGLSDDAVYSFVFKNRPLSLVGPYASFETSTAGYTNGAFYPGSTIAILALNADTIQSGPGRANLIELVDKRSFVQALKKDKFLQKRLGKGALQNANSLSAVHSLMRGQMGGCDLAVPAKAEDMMSGFAVFDYPLTGGDVGVRLALGYGCESMRGSLALIPLTVKPQPVFKALLDAELQTARAAGRKPYFMKYILHGAL